MLKEITASLLFLTLLWVPHAALSQQTPTPTMTHKISKSGYDITALTQADIERLSLKLTPEEANILLARGTQRPFCGGLENNHKEGLYVCKLCGLPLFASNSKFESGSGWPSFNSPFDPEHIREERDSSFAMDRTEIRCARCGSHLGHVFEDGPAPTGLRYCLNSASLNFYEQGEPVPSESRPVATAVAEVNKP